MYEVDYLGEGTSDDAMARKMIVVAGGRPGLARRTPMSGTGKSNLDRRLKGLNAGLRFRDSKLLVLRDLDRDADCAAQLRDTLLNERHSNLVFRIAVRSAESWILADANAYADFCKITVSQIPTPTDAMDDPKKQILAMAGRKSQSAIGRFLAETRKRGVPDWAGLATWNTTFVEQSWDPIRAAESGRSPSLQRAMTQLRQALSVAPHR